MLPDLLDTQEQLRKGATTVAAELERCIAAAQSPQSAHSLVRPMFDEARASIANTDLSHLPLAGLAVTVKDLFDIAGQTTAAGSVALSEAPPALHDCPAVARLRAAGGSLLGRSNMVEFAFSGVGVNPHYGTPAAWDGRFGALKGPARVPGGSSSGAGVSVATGAAFVGLGSDTGGSIRIPAALNGIVGFKNTARLVPAAGAIPLSTTLDTVCALTRSVRDAVVVHEVLSARRVTRSPAPLSQYRLAVPSTLFLEGMDSTVTHAFERTLATLRQHGARIDVIEMAPAAQQPTVFFSPVESYAWHRTLLERAGHQYDPRVSARITKGADVKAWEYLDLLRARQDWIERMEALMAPYDALLSPTVPIVAPLFDEVAPGAERDTAFFQSNALLLRNTSAINLLDGCALSLPCHAQGELPVGLMVWQGAMRDDTVLNISLLIEKILQK